MSHDSLDHGRLFNQRHEAQPPPAARTRPTDTHPPRMASRHSRLLEPRLRLPSSRPRHRTMSPGRVRLARPVQPVRLQRIAQIGETAADGDGVHAMPSSRQFRRDRPGRLARPPQQTHRIPGRRFLHDRFDQLHHGGTGFFNRLAASAFASHATPCRRLQTAASTQRFHRSDARSRPLGNASPSRQGREPPPESRSRLSQNPFYLLCTFPFPLSTFSLPSQIQPHADHGATRIHEDGG